MAVEFINWTTYRIGGGPWKTLDWSEAGMVGTFPAIHLEAIRQATILRHAAGARYADVPDDLGDMSEIIPHANISTLANIIEKADVVAWNKTPYGTPTYYSRPSDFKHYDGTSAWPLGFQTDADMLTEIGDASRVTLPTAKQWVGGAAGDWMRQIAKCLQKRVYIATYQGEFGASYMAGTGYGYVFQKYVDNADQTTAISLFNAAGWTDIWTTPPILASHSYKTPGGGTGHAYQRIRTLSIVKCPGIVPPRAADIYWKFGVPFYGFTYSNPDYGAAEGMWLAHAYGGGDFYVAGGDDVQECGAIPYVNLPTGIGSCGWLLHTHMAIGRWRDEWGLRDV